jgi:transposase, IS30 family
MEKYKQLNMEERSLIQTQLTMGFKPSLIAKSLGRSVSTVTRELQRNGWERTVVKRDRGRPPIAGEYRAVLAQARATVNSAKPRVERRLHPVRRIKTTIRRAVLAAQPALSLNVHWRSCAA